MKKSFFVYAMLILAWATWSCNDNRSTSESNPDSSGTTGTTMGPDSMNNSTTVSTPVNTMPLSKDDSSFVMEAAAGGMMEVEAGKIAQQNGMSQRVKDFGSMMVTDHGKAGQDLSTLASTHGMSLPTSLPADMQKHIDAMKNMKGKSFDQHYTNMMVDDHKKDLAKIKKASTSAGSDDLKTWAMNMVPVIQKHLDSIQAIKKM